MVLRRFGKIAKTVAKRAVKEVAKRASEELARRSTNKDAPSAVEQVHAQHGTDAASHHTAAEDRPHRVAGNVTSQASFEAPSATNSTTNGTIKKASSRKRAAKKRERSAGEQPPQREPLPTRTMARLLMKQARWARALLIYDQLQQEKGPTGAAPDLSLAAERMTAFHQLALEEEAPITWRHLRKRGHQLCLHDPSVREDESVAERPLHLAILRFDRSALVEWDVQRDDRVATGTDFAFQPVHEGDYAIAAVERDGALRWVTPICEWEETGASSDR